MRARLFNINLNFWTESATFEDGVPGERADNRDWGSGPATTGVGWAGTQSVYSTANPHTGTQSAACTINAGSQGWGEWHLEWPSLPGVAEGGEIWMRAWFYHGTDFELNTSSGGKGLRLRNWETDANGNGQYMNTYIEATRILTANGVGVLDGTFLPNNGGSLPTNAPQITNWEHLEMYIKYHSEPGQAIFRAWRNDVLWFEDTLTKTLDKSNDLGGTIAFIYTVFTNDDAGSPKTQTSYVDEVVITSDRPANQDAANNYFIGMGESPPPIASPNPPTNVS